MGRIQSYDGFNYQDAGAGNCAQRSLVHALLLSGTPCSEQMAHELTGVGYWRSAVLGTNEAALKKGLRGAGLKYEECRIVVKERMNAESKFRGWVDSQIDRKRPLIVYTTTDYDSWDHWAVLAGKAGPENYYWIDSVDNELYGKWGWADIEEWARNPEAENDSGDELYYAVAVIPPDEGRMSLVPRFGEAYAAFPGDGLDEAWGVYLEDLLEYFDCPELSVPQIDAKDFFARFSDIIKNGPLKEYAYSERGHVEWEMKNYERVATLHGLTVSASEDALIRAVAGMTGALTMVSVCDGGQAYKIG